MKIYTKTTYEKTKDGKYVAKIMGVIEGPVVKMITAYPDEFSFMRYETKRLLRAKGINKTSQLMQTVKLSKIL